MHKIALLVGDDVFTEKGGGIMRWKSMIGALNKAAECVPVVIRCDRWAGCASSCATTGGEPQRIARTETYFQGKFCANYAEELLARLVDDGFDTLVCSGLDAYQYAPYAAEHSDLRIVCDMHNVESLLYREMSGGVPTESPHADGLADWEVRRVALAERDAVAAAHEVWVCSRNDEALLRRAHPGTAPASLRVVPNVVPVGSKRPAVRPVERLVFIGRLDWFPNVHAVEMLVDGIVPELRAAGVELPVVVAGAAPGPELTKRDYPAGVRLIADPAEVRDLYLGSALLLPLTMGGGSRLKVIEAFALGVPVVSTTKGVEGINVLPDVHYLPAETPQDFSSAVVTISADETRRTDVTREAWRLARDDYSTAYLDELFGAGR